MKKDNNRGFNWFVWFFISNFSISLALFLIESLIFQTSKFDSIIVGVLCGVSVFIADRMIERWC